jgi:hypothetical protein
MQQYVPAIGPPRGLEVPGPGAQDTRAEPPRLSVLSRCVWRPRHVDMGRAMKIRNGSETVGQTNPIGIMMPAACEAN